MLIDAGRSEGSDEGLTGKLWNGDEVIGEFEIVDVYAEGSRGRIKGEITGKITYDTEARVLDR